MTGRDSASVRFESSKLPQRPDMSDHHFAALCPSGRLTGRAGPVKDRTRRSLTLLLRTGELTGRAGQARPASGH
jgi:hypothetical protein